jgi:NCAIR mutase (PurE)-related protein
VLFEFSLLTNLFDFIKRHTCKKKKKKKKKIFSLVSYARGKRICKITMIPFPSSCQQVAVIFAATSDFPGKM